MTYPRGTLGDEWRSYPDLTPIDIERLADVCRAHTKAAANPCNACELARGLGRSIVAARREAPPPSLHAPPRACAMSGYSLTVGAVRGVLNLLDADLPVLLSEGRRPLTLLTFVNRAEVELHPTGYSAIGGPGAGTLGVPRVVPACVLTRGRTPG